MATVGIQRLIIIVIIQFLSASWYVRILTVYFYCW